MTEPAPESQNAPGPQRGARPSSLAVSSQFDENEWPCWIVSRVNGLNIRDRASADSTSNGYLNSGQSIPASCRAVSGGQYQSCGGSNWWIPVPNRGGTDYVAWACVDWYTSEEPPRPRRTYVVRRGDTLSGIARRFEVSLSDLEEANPQIVDPNRILPGQVINIP
jgi:hypothetical protein